MYYLNLDILNLIYQKDDLLKILLNKFNNHFITSPISVMFLYFDIIMKNKYNDNFGLIKFTI